MKRNLEKKYGFSLIEVMVVIVIISILTSIAAISYRSYIVKARRTAVQEELLQLQQKMEEYYTLNHTYAVDNDKNRKKCVQLIDKFNDPIGDKKENSESGFYSITCTLDKGYTLTAKAEGTQAAGETECPILILYRNGTREGGISGDMKINQCW